MNLISDEQRKHYAVKTAATLVTTGTIDQPTAEQLLRSHGVLPQDSNGSSDRTSEVLNGNGRA